MNRPARSSRLLPVASSWIHASVDLPSQARAALVIAPAFFHEAPRSQRLFSLLAEELARLEIAVLRFDYRGCGDSGGADTDFLPSRAIEDCRQAAAWLGAETGRAPVVIGVRAGALLAAAVARAAALRFWAWQPVESGAQLLSELDARERFELGYRLRFPFLRRAPEPDPQVLMGQRLHDDFRVELGALPAAQGFELELAPGTDSERRIGLAGELSDWVGQLDFSGRFSLAGVRALARGIAQRLVN